MIRICAPLLLLALLPGCVVATVAGAAVGTAVSVAGTAVDATTTTQQEADEDRGKAMRKEEERQRKEAEKQRKAEEKQRKEAARLGAQVPAAQTAPDSQPDNGEPPR